MSLVKVLFYRRARKNVCGIKTITSHLSLSFQIHFIYHFKSLQQQVLIQK